MSGTIIQGNPSHITTPLTASVTSLINNGSGLIRANTAAPHYFGQNDEVLVNAGATDGTFQITVISPTAFQLRFPSDEARLELPYSYVLTDGAAAQRYGVGQALTSGTANLFTQFPVPMREAPTLTVGTTISFGVTQAAGTAQTCGTSIGAVASSLTTLGAELLCTTGATNLTAGNATQFTGAATGGLLTFLAEP